MAGYMTNVNLCEKMIIEQAAKETGFDVEFRDHPMPADLYDDWEEIDPVTGIIEPPTYNPDNFIGQFGSVYTNEPYYKDHSDFWNAYWRIRQENAS